MSNTPRQGSAPAQAMARPRPYRHSAFAGRRQATRELDKRIEVWVNEGGAGGEIER